MPPSSLQDRRLAAVMFTDMVGYSGLTQTHEAQALRLLEQHFRMVRAAIRAYPAREIKTIGDAFLIEFDSALAALECAILELVRIPGGSFQMGSNGGDAEEKPVHRVAIRPFLAGRREVTFSEWDACVDGGGCSHRPDDNQWGRGSRPAIRVSWSDAQEYLQWLSNRTGKPYRLLTESEWEYAVRAKTFTDYYWGDAVGQNNAACAGCGSHWDKKQTAPAGSFRPNAFGLHDMLGNVLEWVQDCYHENYVEILTVR